MQPGGRTPSSILRKRAADEQNQRRRSLRAKGGRRVSFAPDDELETMHLFQKDKNSPLSQDTQPLAELANQNQILQHQQMQQLQQPADAMDGHLWPAKPGLEQQFDQAYLLQSPGLSPMSMELTNDTLQQQAALGMVPFGASENDSFPLHPYAAGAAGFKDATHNITDNVPGLSTLVEEDEEEVYNDSSADGSAMELTGNTEVQTQTPRSSSRVTRGSAAAAASPAQPSPATATRSGGRRSSRQGTAASAASPAPSEPLTSPRTRSASNRRSSTGAKSPAASTGGAADRDMQTPPGVASEATAAEPAAAGSQQQRGRPNLAPSMDPTPSPLRRITRSMASPLGSPVTGGFTEVLEAGIAAAAAGGDGGGRSRRSTLNRFADQQNKWGFVPGEDDTMQMDLDMPGAGGLGEATLHHVYSESSGTGELTLAVRQGQLPHRTLPGVTAAPAAVGAAAVGGMGPPAGRAAGRRRSSVGRGQRRTSLATEVIPEEVATPIQPPAAEDAALAAEAATPAGVAAGGEVTEDMAISPDRTPGLLTGQQQQQQEEETPGGVPGFPGAAAADGDCLTTNLLLDDRDLGGWAHVPLAQHASCGTTGRGSVGSNVPTMHLRGGGQTTQLLADSTGGHQPLLPRSSMAAPSGAPLAQGMFGGANPTAAGSSAAMRTSGAAAAPPYEECTTKLLADSTAASACGMMGLFPLPRAGMLGGTIAGGAPVVEPPSAAAAAAVPVCGQRVTPVFGLHQQQQGFGSPELHGAAAGGAFGSPDLPGPGAADPAAAAAATPAASVADMSMELTGATAAMAAAAGDSSPVMGVWQSQQQLTPQSAAQQQRAAAAASPAAEQGSEPTLELAGAASQGGQTNALEDATLEDFALPPDLAAGEERPITMPFSGPLGSLGGARGGITPSSAARTAGASSAKQQRTAQPIAFSDFCQIVDMQFLTHIRRGTSISVMDFQPSSVPQDLSQALQLLAVTSCEVAVLEGAMHKLQSDMQAKRREAYELEDQMGADNPPVFATVQTVRHTQLEQTKHCLVLLKKACRAQTAVSWKQLRQAMEQELAERLAQQQADLAEQLAFVQAKLQKAQQQREYAKAFHADVLKKLAAEQAAQQEAAAARSRLASLRARLEELRGLNADRRQRAEEVQEQVQVLKARCGEVDAETAALLARREQLSAVVAATPQPARSRQAAAKLRSAAHKLELLAGLQGWQPSAVGPGEWLVSFPGKAGIRLHLGQKGMATGRLELLKPAAADVGAQMLAALVAAMQVRFSFSVPTSQLPLAFQQAELALSRAVKLADQCRSLFERQPLLTGVGVADSAAATAAAAAGGTGDAVGQQAWLRLTLIAVVQQLKVDVLLSLGGLLAGNSAAGIDSRVDVLVSPDDSKAQAVQQQLGGSVTAALAARGGSKGMLERVVTEASSCLVAGGW